MKFKFFNYDTDSFIYLFQKKGAIFIVLPLALQFVCKLLVRYTCGKTKTTKSQMNKPQKI